MRRARCRDLERRGAVVLALACDVGDAGIIQVGPLATMTLADVEQAMRVNFWGALHTILAALPGMDAQGDGRIVNVVSIGGKVGVPHLAPYDGAGRGQRRGRESESAWSPSPLTALGERAARAQNRRP